jgi:ferredoxin, 2Fe-2S
MPVFKVSVQPGNICFAAESGETLMAAAQRNGIRWPTVCGGFAQCGVCHVEVLTPHSHYPDAAEAATLRLVSTRPRKGGRLMLACRLRVESDLEVYRIGIRPAHRPTEPE